MILEEILSILEAKTGHKPKASGRGYSARCPCSQHKDKKPSLSVAEGDNGKILFNCHAGCTFETICQELGIKPSQLFNNYLHTSFPNQHYYYHDRDGKVLYRKVRTSSKEFFFEKFENGKWLKGVKDSPRVIYNLPEVIVAIQEGGQVAIVEGEKDVETLRKLGYVATTNDTGGGKTKWQKMHSEVLRDADVILFFDYDNTGVDHRENIINQLKDCVKSLRLVNLPGYEVVPKNGKDITDWLKEGHTSIDLKKVIEEAVVIIEPFKVAEGKILNNIIKAVSIENLLKMEIELPECFLEPFITKSSLGMIYAPRGIGKTYFALSIAYALSSGTSFLKFRAPKPCKVLYLDGEMSIFTMKERMKKIYYSQEIKPLENHFKLVNSFLQEQTLPDLGSLKEQKMLDSLIEDVDVIIVDNLSCWVTSGVENEGESWLPVLAWALKQRRQGKAVVFIHHANKNNGPRGSSRREDALDYVIKLDRPPNYKAEDGACFVLSFEKHRSWLGNDVESIHVKLVDLPDGKQTWEWSIFESNKNNEMLIAEIKRLKSQGKTHEEIGEEFGVSKSTVTRKLRQ